VARIQILEPGKAETPEVLAHQQKRSCGGKAAVLKRGHEKIHRQLPDLRLSFGAGGLRGRGSEHNVERESQTDGQNA
jgi:hypothetical protein